MSRSHSTKAALFAMSILLIACGRDATDDRRSTHVVIDTTAGEVVDDPTAKPTPSPARWITDANALSLLNAVNARELAAVDWELENWHVDTARAFASTMAREHADFQHSIDSLAARLNLSPVSPALAQGWTSAIQAQIDTVRRAGDAGVDLAFVREQVNSHQLMSNYFSQLASVADKPELRAFLQAAAAKSASQSQRALALQPIVARIDSTRRAATSRRGTTR